jgi:phospholipase D1/2
MDYQYKSINRGENSIFGQIRKQGIEPENHVFVFNLRSYDRLNKTPAMKKMEEESGVTYQEVQRAQAEEIMSSGVHGGAESSSSDEGESEDEDKEHYSSRKKKFEARRAAAGLNKDPPISEDSVAKNAMLGEKKVSEEKWDENDYEQEKENWVQEELYVHGKVSRLYFPDQGEAR